VLIRKFWISRPCRVPSYHYAHSLFNSSINLCAVCSWDLCLQLHFTCSCTAVARAHTQLSHDNWNWTCKWLPPDSVRDSIQIRIVATYSIRYFDSNRNFPDSQVPSWWSSETRYHQPGSLRDLITQCLTHQTGKLLIPSVTELETSATVVAQASICTCVCLLQEIILEYNPTHRDRWDFNSLEYFVQVNMILLLLGVV